MVINRLSVSFGIQDTALKWFTSYLTNRTEYTLFNGSKSPVMEGLPSDDPRKIFRGCQWMANVPNGEEKLAKISTG